MDSIEAEVAWSAFKLMKVEEIPGTNDHRCVHLIEENGNTHTLPFYQLGKRDKFDKKSFDDIAKKVLEARQ